MTTSEIQDQLSMRPWALAQYRILREDGISHDAAIAEIEREATDYVWDELEDPHPARPL